MAMRTPSARPQIIALSMNTCDTYPASTSWMVHDFDAIAKVMSNVVEDKTVRVEHHRVGVGMAVPSPAA